MKLIMTDAIPSVSADLPCSFHAIPLLSTSFYLCRSICPIKLKHASDQWYNATAGSGAFHLKIDYKPARHESLTIEQFDLLKVIGKGSFGKVMQVRKKDTQRIYALKTIRKANIASRPGEITHILAERTVLALVNNPFIVPLKFSFQTPDKLYLVMSFGQSAVPAARPGIMRIC